MVQNNLWKHRYLIPTLLGSTLLIGCGGSSGMGTAIAQPINTTGGVSSTPSTTTTPVSSSTQPQQVQVTNSNGQSVTAILPPGESLTPGQPFALISSGTPFLSGLSLSGTATGKRLAPSTAPIQGTISIDGSASGVVLTSGGTFSQSFVLTSGTHTISLAGPITITGTSGATTTISGSMTLSGVIVAPDGTPAIPTKITLALPPDLTAFNGNDSVSVTYPISDFSVGNASLVINYPSGIVLGENLALSNGMGTFTFRHSNENAVPTSTISTVSLGYSR